MLLALVAALASASCVELLGLDPLSSPPDAGPAASREPETDSEVDGGGCSPNPVPSRPEGPGGGGEPVYAATLSLDSPADAGIPIPADLDGRCTVDEGSSSCLLPDNASPNAYLDGVGGADNALLASLAQIESTGTELTGPLGFVFSSTRINARIKQGEYGILFLLREYNGGLDDDDVTLDVIELRRVFTPGNLEGSSMAARPRFGPSDVIYPNTESVALAEAATLIGLARGSGWVRGGVLVVTFPQAVTLHIPVSTDRRPFDLVLELPRGFGKVVPDPLHPRLTELTLTGRVDADKLVGHLANIDVGEQPLAICETPAFDTILAATCAARDLASNPRLDVKAGDVGKARVPCTHLGLVMRAELYDVAPGSLRPPLARTIREPPTCSRVVTCPAR